MPERMGEGEVLISVRTTGVKAAQAALDRLTKSENQRSQSVDRDTSAEVRAATQIGRAQERQTEAVAQRRKETLQLNRLVQQSAAGQEASVRRLGVLQAQAYEEDKSRTRKAVAAAERARKAEEQAQAKARRDRANERRKEESDRRRAERSEERTRQQTRRGLATFGGPARGLGSAFLSVGVFGLAAGTIGAIGLLAAEAVQLSDDLFLAENRLRTFSLAGEDIEKSLERVTDVAAENGAQIIATTKLYNAFQQTLQNIGGTAEDAIRDTSTFLRVLRISGVTATEAGASTQQFIQGFRADRFAGDELRSLLENVGFFGFLLRRHFPGENVRDLGAEGLITRDVVQQVFRENQETIDRLAASIELSLGQLATNLQSQFGLSAFDAFRDSGLTDELRGLLTDLTDVLASDEVKEAMTDFASLMANIVSLLRSDFVPNIVTVLKNLENAIIAFETVLSVFGIGSLASSLKSFNLERQALARGGLLSGAGANAGKFARGLTVLGNLGRFIPGIGGLISGGLLLGSAALSRSGRTAVRERQAQRQNEPLGDLSDFSVGLVGLGRSYATALNDEFRVNLDFRSPIEEEIRSIQNLAEEQQIRIDFFDDPGRGAAEASIVRSRREIQGRLDQLTENEEEGLRLIAERAKAEAERARALDQQTKAYEKLDSLAKSYNEEVRAGYRALAADGAELARTQAALLELPTGTSRTQEGREREIERRSLQSEIFRLQERVIRRREQLRSQRRDIGTEDFDDNQQRQDAADTLKEIDRTGNAAVTATEKVNAFNEALANAGYDPVAIAHFENQLRLLGKNTESYGEYVFVIEQASRAERRRAKELARLEAQSNALSETFSAPLADLGTAFRDAIRPSDFPDLESYLEAVRALRLEQLRLEQGIARSLGDTLSASRIQGTIDILENADVSRFGPAAGRAFGGLGEREQRAQDQELFDLQRSRRLEESISLGNRLGDVLGQAFDTATDSAQGFDQVLGQIINSLRQIAIEEIITDPAREFFRNFIGEQRGFSDTEIEQGQIERVRGLDAIPTGGGLSEAPTQSNTFNISSFNPTESARLVGDVIQGAGIEGGSVYINNPSLNRD